MTRPPKARRLPSQYAQKCPETRQLFGYAEIEDDKRWSAIADTDVCKKWWAHMKDLMPSNPDDSPVSRELKEVFHIDSSREVLRSSSSSV